MNASPSSSLTSARERVDNLRWGFLLVFYNGKAIDWKLWSAEEQTSQPRRVDIYTCPIEPTTTLIRRKKELRWALVAVLIERKVHEYINS